MKIGALLSVREKATRLPGKVLLDLDGTPVTVRLLRRLRQVKGIDQVILATSTHTDDTVLVELAGQSGFDAFRGSEEDKLRRYRDAASHYRLDAVVIVDGDDPLCFPEAVAAVAGELRHGNADCVYITGLPLGAAATGLTRSALERVLELKAENDTEVWGGYFIGSGRFSARELHLDDPLLNHPEIRLTLDYPEDFALIDAVYKEFPGRDDVSGTEIMDLLIHRRPELATVNREAQRKYEEHIARAAPVRFKES